MKGMYQSVNTSINRKIFLYLKQKVKKCKNIMILLYLCGWNARFTT